MLEFVRTFEQTRVSLRRKGCKLSSLFNAVASNGDEITPEDLKHSLQVSSVLQPSDEEIEALRNLYVRTEDSKADLTSFVLTLTSL